MLSTTTSSAIVLATYVFMITCNVFANTGNAVFPVSNTKIADSVKIYISPDGVTFSVWGINYLLTTLFVVYQALPAYRDDVPSDARTWASVAFSLNGTWLFLFSNELYWTAQMVITGYLAALVMAYRALDANYAFGSEKTHKQKLFLYAGFSCTTSWVLVATVLGFTLTCYKNGWESNADWAIGLIFAVTCIAVYVVATRMDVPYAAVAAWALWGVYRARKNVEPLSDAVANASIVAIVAVVLALVASGAYHLGQSREKKDEAALALSKPIIGGTADYGSAAAAAAAV